MAISMTYHPKERVKLVRAMETIARCINDEDVFEGWLMCGVADGDIEDDTPDDDILATYCNSTDLQELMECFLRCMKAARVNGGLFCDGITTREEMVK